MTTENLRGSRQTPDALLDPKAQPLVAQHDTEGGRFASALQTARVVKTAESTPSTEIKLGYQGIESGRGNKARA